jgi:hypothetical protein
MSNHKAAYNPAAGDKSCHPSKIKSPEMFLGTEPGAESSFLVTFVPLQQIIIKSSPLL